jgi:hypothetical protein
VGLLTSGKHHEKLATIDRVMSLAGLAAPTKIAPTTPDGDKPYDPYRVLVPHFSQRHWRSLLFRARASAN